MGVPAICYKVLIIFLYFFNISNVAQILSHLAGKVSYNYVAKLFNYT